MPTQSVTRVYIQLLLTAMFWGGTFVAGRVVSRQIPPFSAAFFRFAIAAAFLIPFALFTEKQVRQVKARQIPLLILLGMTGVFSYNFFFFKGLQLIAASRASLIVANNPIMIALFSAYFFKERLTPLKVIGIVCSVSGAIIVITRGHVLDIFQGSVGKGELLILGCVASWVTYSLIGKLVMRELSPLVAVTYSTSIGALALLTPALFEGVGQQFMHYSGLQWFSLFYLGFFGTVLGFIWYYQGIHQIGPTRAGLFINFVPISAILAGYLLLDEPITYSLLVGALFVSTGVYLTNKRPAVAVPSHRK